MTVQELQRRPPTQPQIRMKTYLATLKRLKRLLDAHKDQVRYHDTVRTEEYTIFTRKSCHIPAHWRRAHKVLRFVRKGRIAK